MKKLFFACALTLGSLSLYSCGGNSDTTASDNENVIERDTTVSELEVQETVVQTDTTTQTETIDRETNQEQNQ
ncbi:hypothetical protein [Pontibacter harenae]|uniref:hypothetical protein n=1 Tax=Pontibacter harenae TaxID=2894083 RepID=UPI001E3286D6|nr:hypothetical protein [Pontibacter harenae]MCC9166628.1 hypothetical protein [Pontibacter harenae]